MNWQQTELLLAEEELLDAKQQLKSAEAHLDNQLALFDGADANPRHREELKFKIVQVFKDLDWVEKDHVEMVTTHKLYRTANSNLRYHSNALIGAYKNRAFKRGAVRELTSRIRSMKLYMAVEE